MAGRHWWNRHAIQQVMSAVIRNSTKVARGPHLNRKISSLTVVEIAHLPTLGRFPGRTWAVNRLALPRPRSLVELGLRSKAPRVSSVAACLFSHRGRLPPYTTCRLLSNQVIRPFPVRRGIQGRVERMRSLVRPPSEPIAPLACYLSQNRSRCSTSTPDFLEPERIRTRLPLQIRWRLVARSWVCPFPEGTLKPDCIGPQDRSDRRPSYTSRLPREGPCSRLRRARTLIPDCSRQARILGGQRLSNVRTLHCSPSLRQLRAHTCRR